MKQAKNILESKGNVIWAVNPESTVLDAIGVMADKRIGALLVMKGDSLAGVFSERDYARKVVLMGKSSRETAVGEIMTSEVVVSTPENTIEECMSLMTTKRIRHLPVVADNKVVGVLSIGDLVNAIIEDQQHHIEQLESYITQG
jgi:CBS domain-containing protein